MTAKFGGGGSQTRFSQKPKFDLSFFKAFPKYKNFGSKKMASPKKNWVQTIQIFPKLGPIKFPIFPKFKEVQNKIVDVFHFLGHFLIRMLPKGSSLGSF